MRCHLAVWSECAHAHTCKQANGLRTRWTFIQMPGQTIRSTYFLVVIVLHVHTNDKCHFLLFLKNMHFYHSIIFMQSICICVSVSLTCIALFIFIQHHHHHHWRRFSCLSHARPKEIITNSNSTKKNMPHTNRFASISMPTMYIFQVMAFETLLRKWSDSF